MHELSLCRNLLEMVLQEAARNQASRVLQVEVELGELQGIAAEQLRYHFDLLKVGTVAAEASLQVAIVPARAACPVCNTQFPTTAGFTCPNCSQEDAQLISGLEVRVKSLRIV